MSRITSLTSKIAFIVLFIGVFCQPLFAFYGQKDISITSLMQRMTLTDFIKLMGPNSILDTTFQLNEKGKSVKIVRFAPVQFEGFSAICEATLLNDSVASINLYLPYRAHSGVKPEAPYAVHNFVRATLEDFNKVGDSIIKSLGLPTISTETYIDYIQNGIQTVFGSLKGNNITITIYPQISH